MLLQWTSGLLHYQRDQQIIVQRHSSRLVMSVREYNEITEAALNVITPQSKGYDFKRFVARALVGSENWLNSQRQISKPFSVS